MKADSLNAKDLFGKQVRYVVPTFQRPYVWTQEDQWEPFWDDVQHAADRYLEELDHANDLDGSRAAAEQRVGRHFLGAVVVKQLPTKLTVERTMPQAWSLHWPLPVGVDSVQGELDRNRLLQTFGNLTLATTSLNSTMSNHSWTEKRKHLDANSVLLLNKWVLSRASETAGSGEDNIRARSGSLFERAVRIWPRP